MTRVLGVKDLIVGAPFVNDFRGGAYVLFLKNDVRKPVKAQTFLDQERFAFNELKDGSYLDSAVTTSSADIDGDSYDDLVIATERSGEVFIFWGNVRSLLTSDKSFTGIDLRYPSS